ncbi:MAG TPA: NAD(P)H-hydrate dehydratase, partial [Cyclobacteriaceae bacterium]|nr:NAD(P)H-hydrate dehydratase [Cyclobacteriaceae bacterium]
DAHTIRHEPIASIDLMERACMAFTAWFTAKFLNDKTIGVVCGTGNNGGDGLGIARLLSEQGYDVKIWIVRGAMPESEDFTVNLKRIRGKIPVFEIVSEADQNLFSDRSILIDAIFGSGLSRPAEGTYAQAISCMNNTPAIRVAVDMPSGLMADEPSFGEIVKADYTVTFQIPKLSFLFPQNNGYVGSWQVVDIGLDRSFMADAAGRYFVLEQQDIKQLLKPRLKFDHKGNYGHALLIAGSYGKMGAAILSARAALRSGAGLLTAHVPGCGYAIMQTSVPEAMTSIDGNEEIISAIPDTTPYSAIGMGPGIGQDKKTQQAFQTLLETSAKPVVIDADALNILGSNRELIHLLPKNAVLTPHPKEFERLAGSWKNDFERLKKQIDFSVKTGTVVLLKGAHSSISTPEGNVYFNNTGNPGMATGGSGDVLTGIITGLLAQGYSARDSALIGCWVHGLAGDRAAGHFGQISMIASDITAYLPDTFRI